MAAQRRVNLSKVKKKKETQDRRYQKVQKSERFKISLPTVTIQKLISEPVYATIVPPIAFVQSCKALIRRFIPSEQMQFMFPVQCFFLVHACTASSLRAYGERERERERERGRRHSAFLGKTLRSSAA